MDLFTIAKNEARNAYKDNIQSLDEYAAALQKAIRMKIAMMGYYGSFSDTEIADQARKTASWWWRNVFHKQNRTEETSMKPKGSSTPSGAVSMLQLIHEFGGCIIDTETTGLSKDDRIIELSIIDMEGSVLYSSLFDPGIPLSLRIIELTGITDRMLHGKPRFEDEAEKISDILSRHIITGWNVSFDIRMLKQEFMRIDASFDDSNTHDLMALCSTVLGKESRNVKLMKLKDELGIGCSQDHRSLADCRDTLAVMEAVIARWNEENRPRWNPSTDISSAEEEEEDVPF